MKLAKTFVIVVCAGLLSAGVLGSARHAYAQESGASDPNQGAWGAAEAANADESSGKTKVHPLDIRGCWAGSVVDTGDGVGTATFHFDQSSKLKKMVLGTEFDFEWPADVFARAPMKGTVSATGFKFTAKVVDQGKICTVTGTATGDETMLMGTVEFGGYCPTVSLFQNVTFSITPGCP